MLDKKKQIRYLGYTIFTILFSAIYEAFSFGVNSYHMIYAFIYPLIGLIINYLLYKKNQKEDIRITLFDMSILTFTLRSIILGILEIYGTTNSLTIYFTYSGIILLSLSVILSVIKKIKGA